MLCLCGGAGFPGIGLGLEIAGRNFEPISKEEDWQDGGDALEVVDAGLELDAEEPDGGGWRGRVIVFTVTRLGIELGIGGRIE